GPLAERAALTLEAEGRHGTARLERATTDLGEAVEGAEILIAPLPATGHEDLAKRLAPCLTDRQIVLLTPGTLGSYAVARGIVRAGGTLPLAVAETGTLPYLARKTAPAAVKAAVRATNLPVGLFPAPRSASRRAGAGATRRPTTSSRRTTTRRGRPKGSTAPGRRRSSWRAGSGARSSPSSTGTSPRTRPWGWRSSSRPRARRAW